MGNAFSCVYVRTCVTSVVSFSYYSSHTRDVQSGRGTCSKLNPEYSRVLLLPTFTVTVTPYFALFDPVLHLTGVREDAKLVVAGTSVVL